VDLPQVVKDAPSLTGRNFPGAGPAVAVSDHCTAPMKANYAHRFVAAQRKERVTPLDGRVPCASSGHSVTVDA